MPSVNKTSVTETVVRHQVTITLSPDEVAHLVSALTAQMNHGDPKDDDFARKLMTAIQDAPESSEDGPIKVGDHVRVTGSIGSQYTGCMAEVVEVDPTDILRPYAVQLDTGYHVWVRDVERV